MAHLQAALGEIEALPMIDANGGADPAAVESAAPELLAPISTKKIAGARPKAAR